MTPQKARSNAEWLADLGNPESCAEALADLREYLLRAVFVYLDQHREDLTQFDWQELEHLAEDFCQEALIQILAGLNTFRGESKFTTWAYRFVINVAAGDLRLHRWRTLSIDALVGEQDISRSALLIDREADKPETMVARRQILDLIDTIISKELTARQRYALVAVHLYDVPVVEVARQLNVNPNAVYKLIHDARKNLKRGLLRRHYSQADVLSAFD